MLLNQFKTGVAASAFLPGGRDGWVRRGVGSLVSRRVALGVRATGAAGGAGRLESSSRVTGFGSQAGSQVDDKSLTRSPGQKDGSGLVKYKGKVEIMKKLFKLDLIDRKADVLDDASELLGRRVTFQLIGDEIDPKTGKPTLSEPVPLKNWVSIETLVVQNLTFNIEFSVDSRFGIPHAILVRNKHPNEFLLVSFSLEIPRVGEAHYLTNSWVYNTGNTDGRIFFSNKAYLPAETPAALREYREKELQQLRGDGKGERKEGDRIYDYDIYSDLGKPEENKRLERPNLGGNAEYPYPRRVRTGRPLIKGTNYETRKKVKSFYIPHDEEFERVKMSDFSADFLRAKDHGDARKFISKITQKKDFDSVKEIRGLYAPKGKDLGGLDNLLPDKEDVGKKEQFPLVFMQELIKPDGQWHTPLQFALPQILHEDDNAWQTNVQFAREFLAGLNPVVISLVKEFPLKSGLDPKKYGDPTSAITAEHIEGQLDGLTVDEAVKNKKLFVADYHDAYLPFVERINAQEDSKTYATRALFYLQDDDTLKVLALELVLPPKSAGGAKVSKVVTPPADTSKVNWYWECAKAHVLNNDIVAHQVFSHFTNCHAVTEVYIIATARHLSKLHPINHLMTPHFKSTLEINRNARSILVSAEGAVEKSFTPKAYSMRMAAANYRDNWTFESQCLPKDLIARGMAEEDKDSEHGIKLLIKDYPYAKDGLDLWFAIQEWNTEYIDSYYKDDDAVVQDEELQSWWDEIRNRGHADKKDADGWPDLKTRASLVEIVTVMQWIPSCQHAAVNFGQYAYAGFMPHHPSLTRRLLPDEDDKELQKNGEKYYLSTVSDVISTISIMSLYEVLSAHSPCEIYIGDRPPNWCETDKVKEALKQFSNKLKEIDNKIQARNKNTELKNRLGAAKLPYNLLRPKSGQGNTAMGVPNSITI